MFVPELIQQRHDVVAVSMSRLPLVLIGKQDLELFDQCAGDADRRTAPTAVVESRDQRRSRPPSIPKICDPVTFSSVGEFLRGMEASRYPLVDLRPVLTAQYLLAR